MARRSSARVYGKSAVKIRFDFDAEKTLLNLENGIKAALRPAAHQASLVLYNEMRQRVPVNAGTLQGSIYRKHLDGQSNQEYQVYAVGPNKSKAPHWYLIEYGHYQYRKVINIDGKFVTTKQLLATPRWVPPKSYIRSTWEAKKAESFGAAKKRISELVGETMKELASA